MYVRNVNLSDVTDICTRMIGKYFKLNVNK